MSLDARRISCKSCVCKRNKLCVQTQQSFKKASTGLHRAAADTPRRHLELLYSSKTSEYKARQRDDLDLSRIRAPPPAPAQGSLHRLHPQKQLRQLVALRAACAARAAAAATATDLDMHLLHDTAATATAHGTPATTGAASVVPTPGDVVGSDEMLHACIAARPAHAAPEFARASSGHTHYCVQQGKLEDNATLLRPLLSWRRICPYLVCACVLVVCACVLAMQMQVYLVGA